MSDKRIVGRVATVWTDPAAVRDIDAPIVAAVPDVVGWTNAMTLEDRLDLHGRIVTQSLPGEPVIIDSERDGWAEVALPWQPSSLDPRGYPGWIRVEHLADGDDAHAPGDIAAAVSLPGAGRPEPGVVDGQALLATAERFLGMDYLWAGFSGYGVDCSGLVSLTHRSHGVVIPRDAHDQARSGEEVDLAELRAGDLVFFGADEGLGPVHHVGMAAGNGTMVHAPRTGRQVEVCPLSAPGYAEELCAARRYF
jgi:cell wall-associated NlpC family hydrolase